MAIALMRFAGSWRELVGEAMASVVKDSLINDEKLNEKIAYRARNILST